MACVDNWLPQVPAFSPSALPTYFVPAPKIWGFTTSTSTILVACVSLSLLYWDKYLTTLLSEARESYSFFEVLYGLLSKLEDNSLPTVDIAFLKALLYCPRHAGRDTTVNCTGIFSCICLVRDIFRAKVIIVKPRNKSGISTIWVELKMGRASEERGKLKGSNFVVDYSISTRFKNIGFQHHLGHKPALNNKL